MPEARRKSKPSPLPEWYWEPVDAQVKVEPRPIDLPVVDASLVRVEGATRLWDELGEEGRERVRRDGLVVAPGELLLLSRAAESRVGVFYTYVREQRLPYLVTLDALAFAVHVAVERAVAEVDEVTLAPGLRGLLALLGARLGAEQRGAGVELGEGLRLARSVVAVATALAEKAGVTTAPPDIVADVVEEVLRIDAHEGPRVSALLGVTIDYARFAPPPKGFDPGAFRALTWLASAPLVLVAKSEVPGSPVDLSTARTHARAAMVLARAIDRDVDPEIHLAWSRLARLLAFLWGPPDDLSPTELGELGATVDVDVESPKQIANVVKVDRLRKRAAAGRAPLVFDGAGAPGKAGLSMRVLGGHAPIDSVVLGSLVGPALGRTLAGTIPPNARGGVRTLPSTLDLPAFFGAREARAALRESGADAFPGFDATLSRLASARPPPDAASRHASVYGSLLDALMTWLPPGAEARPVLDSPAANRAAIESALAAWTFVRHDARPLARGPVPRRASATPGTGELAVGGAPLPAFVEPAPEVIAHLATAVAQLKRGLLALDALDAKSPSLVLLAEVEDVLRTTLRVAARQVNDEALLAEDLAALASIPARLARIEGVEGVAGVEGAGNGGGAAARVAVPVVADVLSDPGGNRVLVSATGKIEPALIVAREPGTGRLLLTVGAHVAHYEVVDRARARALGDDASLRALLDRGPAPFGEPPEDKAFPARGAYTSAFRMVPPGRAR